jgi:uncharacterized NAD-dependent epimerase/dehydratase family protein
MSTTTYRFNPPYLLFLGDVHDPRQAKTASGVLYWRRGNCLGQLRLADCKADLGLPDLTPAEAANRGARSLLIGLAPPGGTVADTWLEPLGEALRAGLDIISGMHVQLSTEPRLQRLAREHSRRIIEVRSSPQPLTIGTGRRRPGKRLLTVGTDCAVGKMFAALAIEREMLRRGQSATFRATGQTGIMIAGEGICIDAIVSDFAAGAAETLSPDNEPQHWDLIEGQGSLFHPAYAGVTLALLHGSQPDAIVVCHDYGREMIVGVSGYRVPTFEECMQANLAAGRLVNADVAIAGVCVNTSTMSETAALAYLGSTAERLGIPACDPLRTGVSAIVDRLL